MLTLPGLFTSLLTVAAVKSENHGVSPSRHATEDDIILTPDQASPDLPNDEGPSPPQAAVIKGAMYIWPGGIVPYQLDPGLTQQGKTAILEAISLIERNTCIQFVKRTSEEDNRDYLNFIYGSGCASNVGLILETKEQNLTIGKGCEFTVNAVHEIFHALGRFHEHNRPDRDDYISINWENILPEFQDDFVKVSRLYAKTQGLPYSYSSIMHFTAYAYAISNQPTIVPLNESIPTETLGQNIEANALDYQHINVLYCGEQIWSEWSSWSECSVSCGNEGVRVRERYCQNGDECTGKSKMEESCEMEEDCPATCSDPHCVSCPSYPDQCQVCISEYVLTINKECVKESKTLYFALVVLGVAVGFILLVVIGVMSFFAKNRHLCRLVFGGYSTISSSKGKDGMASKKEEKMNDLS